MENKISILENIVVLVTCSNGSVIRYDDYYYCGNGMLAYYNSDYARYPEDNNYFECFGKFSGEYGPVYYIPPKYIDEVMTHKFNRLTFKNGYKISDFEASKVIDADTMETSHLNAEGYKWYEVLKKQADRYKEIYKIK